MVNTESQFEQTFVPKSLVLHIKLVRIVPLVLSKNISKVFFITKYGNVGRLGHVISII